MSPLTQLLLLSMTIVAGAKPLHTDPATVVNFSSNPIETGLTAQVDSIAYPDTETTIPPSLRDFYASHDIDISSDNDQGRFASCDEATCPVFVTPFDLVRHVISLEDSGPLPGPLIFEHWAGRVNDCGQCIYTTTGRDGCWDFTSCGRPQQICVDRNNNRASRVWKDGGPGGTKVCSWTHMSWSTCDRGRWSEVWAPIGDTTCAW
ncbi:hypothetical protein BDV98DRAFT_577581 [Pterulicium gracile]|uniref:Uncharacterized protein n=1 Tax=Pterulicium gracile TaxID=1884261 RepID=A0A5C3Q155_9AGAR|nr:hypothetical protein BDV98DRAFT_577581 [Pterula gracilis]